MIFNLTLYEQNETKNFQSLSAKTKYFFGKKEQLKYYKISYNNALKEKNIKPTRKIITKKKKNRFH